MASFDYKSLFVSSVINERDSYEMIDFGSECNSDFRVSTRSEQTALIFK